MATSRSFLKQSVIVLFLSSGLTGCESTDSDTAVSGGGVYYGSTFYDPWYYGDYDYPPDVIVTPPVDRPDSPPRPVQPIYNPPGPSVNPLPSIPSTPRPALRR